MADRLDRDEALEEVEPDPLALLGVELDGEEVVPVDDDTQQRIYEDDLELFRFGYNYLKMVFKIEDAKSLNLSEAGAAPPAP